MDNSTDPSTYNETISLLLSLGVPEDAWYKFESPNYVDPVLKGHYSSPVVAVLLALSWTIVPLRLYTRIRVLKSFAPDDWFIIPALFAATAMSILTFVKNAYGGGRHLYDVPIENLEPLYKIDWISTFVYGFAIALAKFSLLMFYRRFANKTWFRIAVWVMFGYTFIWMVEAAILTCIACHPIEFNWADVPGSCWEQKILSDIFYTNAFTNTFGDLVIFLLPLPTVILMNLPYRQKLGLFIIFFLGILTIIASVVRIIYLFGFTYSDIWDTTWSSYDLSLCTNFEIHVTLFCSSAPVLKPLMVRMGSFVNSHVSAAKMGSEASDTSVQNPRQPMLPGESALQTTCVHRDSEVVDPEKQTHVGMAY